MLDPFTGNEIDEPLDEIGYQQDFLASQSYHIPKWIYRDVFVFCHTKLHILSNLHIYADGAI